MEEPADPQVDYNNFAINEAVPSIYPEQQITESLNKLSTSEDSLKFRKRIRVGNHYQARIPKLNETDEYEEHGDELLWNPLILEASQVEKYLEQIVESRKHILPMGAHLRDDEEALLILQQSGHDIQLATHRLSNGAPEHELRQWNETECRGFERGLLNFGKNFFLIQKYRVPSRDVRELVQFYYLWKKTERYDLFAHRMRGAKKKYALNPGISDLMCRYLGRPKGALGADVQFILTDDKEETVFESSVADE